ncbi:NAD-dependent epimerase/dehydratase family protein [Salinicoccus luteus]|uniref:NAD-dependent epimerase/dehydratase family protein n=1 Tax=Salinicoccus luteus TaxID=367840 RepID=UPI0004E27E84|nr:NAD-dependent epimerase/dehydratase family protein [Salinicoccus luteus]
MNKILITGENGYISQSLKSWIMKKSSEYHIDLISLRNDDWKNYDFSSYDSIVHTVGIAHVDSNPDEKMRETYYKVNRDLAIEVGKKAKEEGVSQFIFLSSIIVYGNHNSYISKETSPEPENFYGNSKLEAEKGISVLEDKDFIVAIVRLPMVYGKGSKGNYPLLAKMARLTPVFPKVNNKRSMIHIDNLCEFLYLLIRKNDRGLYHPQNEEYVNTSILVKEISKTHNRPLVLTGVFNSLIKFAQSKSMLFQKVFGDLVYDQSLSEYSDKYNIRSFEESIRITENKE